MRCQDDPGAVRAWALRSAAVATLARYVGIVETFADEVGQDDGEMMH